MHIETKDMREIDKLAKFLMEEFSDELQETEFGDTPVDVAIQLLSKKEDESPEALFANAVRMMGQALKNEEDIREAENELNKLGFVVSEKPVIPEFVAEWIENELKAGTGNGENSVEDMIYIVVRFGYGNGLNVDPLFNDLKYEFSGFEHNKIREYLTKNKMKVIEAIMNGYEVEKEKLYNVQFYKLSEWGNKMGLYLYKKDGSVYAGDNFKVYRPDREKYQLTEQEIKRYDEQMWQFAEEVTP